jgi:esterase
MDDINEKCFEPETVAGSATVYLRCLSGGKVTLYYLTGDMDTLKNMFPMARLVTIPDAGHWLHAEQPDAFIEAIRKFAG